MQLFPLENGAPDRVASAQAGLPPHAGKLHSRGASVVPSSPTVSPPPPPLPRPSIPSPRGGKSLPQANPLESSTPKDPTLDHQILGGQASTPILQRPSV